MVKPLISEKADHNATKLKPSFIVELIGPAGAGKTTLARAISQCDDKILLGPEMELRKIEHIPIFLSHSPFLLPLLMNGCRKSRGFSWPEIKKMVYLQAWARVLRQQASNNDTVILLDQGPIFKLATLDAFGPERFECQEFERWWHSTCEHWAFILDLIIWLDAPEAVLMERINNRKQRHAIKGKSDAEAHRFLARYRMSYKRTLDKLTFYGRPSLLQFDTSQATPEEIADRILVACGINPCGS